MKTKKYKLGKKEKNGLRRVIALKNFGNVKKGDIGGFVKTEKNLSQHGLCWVFGNAWVYGSARVYGDAWVYGSARVYGDAQVFGNAWVYGSARVYGDAWVYGSARVYGKIRFSKGKLCSKFNFEYNWQVKLLMKKEKKFLVKKKEIEKKHKHTWRIIENGIAYHLAQCIDCKLVDEIPSERLKQAKKELIKNETKPKTYEKN